MAKVSSLKRCHATGAVVRGERRSTWKGDIDDRWDVVDQLVTRQRSRQAQRRFGSPDRDLDQVGIGIKIRLDEDPACELFDQAAITPAVQETVRHT